MAVEKRVLVVDDDEVMLQSCRSVLERVAYTIECQNTGRAGLERIKTFRPSVLVVDLKMPELDGFQVIERARAIDPELVMVVITGYATIETAVDAMKAGAYDFLPKPFTPAELRLIIDRSYERWRLAQESARLQREKEELERKFVAVVSHQLKSPLAAIKQNLDVILLSREALPERAVQAADRAQTRLGEMLGIIDDTLTLTRLEKAALSETSASTDLCALVRAVMQQSAQAAEQAEVRLVTELPDAPVLARGDELSLGMLVGNLVSNAIKYNRRGGAVTASLTQAAGQARLEVRDTGIGIPESCIPLLFQELYRVKSDATRGIPGTGLGLAICKKIVTELGGGIVVTSAENSGSNFTVTLPLRDAAVQGAGRKS
jgi:two-component system, sensor histidine kinase and response regulator